MSEDSVVGPRASGFSPGKDGEAGDIGFIVDAAGCGQAENKPLEARSSFPTEPDVVEPVLTGFRLKNGAKVAEAVVFSREIGYHGAVNMGEWGRIHGSREMPVEVRFRIDLPI